MLVPCLPVPSLRTLSLSAQSAPPCPARPASATSAGELSGRSLPRWCPTGARSRCSTPSTLRLAGAALHWQGLQHQRSPCRTSEAAPSTPSVSRLFACMVQGAPAGATRLHRSRPERGGKHAQWALRGRMPRRRALAILDLTPVPLLWCRHRPCRHQTEPTAMVSTRRFAWRAPRTTLRVGPAAAGLQAQATPPATALPARAGAWPCGWRTCTLATQARTGTGVRCAVCASSVGVPVHHSWKDASSALCTRACKGGAPAMSMAQARSPAGHAAARRPHSAGALSTAHSAAAGLEYLSRLPGRRIERPNRPRLIVQMTGSCCGACPSTSQRGVRAQSWAPPAAARARCCDCSCACMT